MKLNNRKLEGGRVEVIVFPRQTGDLVFKAQTVTDYSELERLCPRPVPKVMSKPNGDKVSNEDQPVFKAALNDWAGHHTNWMILRSLVATESLEWETVDIGDPLTWNNLHAELAEAGLSQYEVSMLVDLVITANGLSAEKIEAATKSFLAGQEAKVVVD